MLPVDTIKLFVFMLIMGSRIGIRLCHAFPSFLARRATPLMFASHAEPTRFRTCFTSIAQEDQTFRRSFTVLSSSEDRTENGSVTPTWTYTPYKPPKQKPQQQRRRNFATGTWKVPKEVKIPEDQVELNFVRSSGSGGQNVNKVNTKVELRFHVMSATWMPKEVRERLLQQQANRINKEGFMSISSQEYRTQAQNRKDAFSKLESLALQAWERPKERKMRKGISKKAKERNKENKRRRSQVKKNRGRVDF